jgi:HEPN domain-containing protein
MKPITLEWVEKAEGDFASAKRELRARKSPNYDAACFHAQQCAEKYLKARLQEAEIPFPKTHDLTQLLNLLLPIEPLFENLRVFLVPLTSHAVNFRYPGEFSTKEIAKTVVHDCTEARRSLRRSLELPEYD